jgi:hypothetical protein
MATVASYYFGNAGQAPTTLKKHTFDFQGHIIGGMFLKSGSDSAPSIDLFFKNIFSKTCP